MFYAMAKLLISLLKSLLEYVSNQLVACRSEKLFQIEENAWVKKVSRKFCKSKFNIMIKIICPRLEMNMKS